MKPFASRGRHVIAAILGTIALLSIISVGLSIRETSRSRHQAAVVEVAARQRTLAQQYLSDVLIARSGGQSDPAYTGSLLQRSARTLLNGGTAPAANGDDDATTVAAPTDPIARDQLRQAQRLGSDLVDVGQAFLAGKPLRSVRLTAGERLAKVTPVESLRALTALNSNVSLNAARTIVALTDRNVNGLVTTQAVIGGVGLLISLLLGAALIAATRRQSAHFRSLVTSSTDLVAVFGNSGCLYASKSVAELVGREEDELLGDGFESFVRPDDRELLAQCASSGQPGRIVLRLVNRFGEWRQLEAIVTDLRSDRDVRGVVINARDISERLRLEVELTRQAFHDGLTGLPNRALFRDRLEQALTRARASNEPVSVLLLDLDGFKQVNDSLGHDAGDRLLEAVARRFAGPAGPSDTLARLGGDEFALLIENSRETRALTVAERMLQQLKEPFSIVGRELAMNCSIGIAVAAPRESNAEELIRDADIAMYAAKEAGRGRCEVFRRAMAREFGEILGLEHELRLALKQDEMSVHFQPEVTLDGKVVGVEALLRWNSPTRGSVPPNRFIPLAERNGMIFDLGAFVMREACAQTARWRAEDLLPASFVTWVNVSVQQLSSGGLYELVAEVLEEIDLPPQLLGVEVTETAVVEGVGGERAKAELEQLHAIGVKVAIDDFGTGFSALGQLRHLPIDMLKVDRSFVRGIEHDPKDAAITENLINLAHTLGVVAIAEGIESRGQLERVRGFGCDLAQGFLFGRPMEGASLTALLSERAPDLQTAIHGEGRVPGLRDQGNGVSRRQLVGGSADDV